MATPARALQIVLSGVMGSRAALVVDGRTHVLAVGEQLPRLRLLGVDGQEVRLEVDGKPRVLRLGDAPVRSGAGWHLIRLEDVRPAQPPRFEDVKPRIVESLIEQKWRSYVKELQARAVVK